MDGDIDRNLLREINYDLDSHTGERNQDTAFVSCGVRAEDKVLRK